MITLDVVEPANLTGFVREVPSPANYTLNTWLPDETIADIEAEFDNVIKLNRAAKFRAFDSETPIGLRPGLERKKKKSLSLRSVRKLRYWRSKGSNWNGQGLVVTPPVR